MDDIRHVDAAQGPASRAILRAYESIKNEPENVIDITVTAGSHKTVQVPVNLVSPFVRALVNDTTVTKIAVYKNIVFDIANAQ